MDDLSSRASDRRRMDIEQLKILSAFHFIGVGLAVLGLFMIYGHHAFVAKMLEDANLWKNVPQQQPPLDALRAMGWMYGVGAVIVAGTGLLNLFSALALRARRNRLLSFGVAIVNCFYFPLGTTLGIFTIVVLVRESVRELYSAPAPRD